jgi:DNA processing protein
MMLNEELAAWVVLTRGPALEAPAIAAALEFTGSVRHLFGARAVGLEDAGLSATARGYLRSTAPLLTVAERSWLEHPRHHFLPFIDPHYPQLLRHLPDRPVGLYVSGNLAALAEPQLAVVGSRQASAPGCETAGAFSEQLARRGLAISSGLAHGIDSAAHRGALAVQGVTLAVLGSGIDVIYPPGNRRLSEQIEASGALVSEFPLGAAPRPGHFPRRNRTLAGMCLGTLVVEAARRSGSLITARAANERGREVFAVPGSIHNPLSRGCHELIKQGAKLTESADDILTELNFSAFFATESRAPGGGATRVPGTAGMDKEHKILLDALGFDPADLDMLIVRTGFKPEAVSSMMLILELEGHVQAAPGGRYSRVVNRRAGGER